MIEFVLTSDDTLEKAMTSIRDWGRDCWCPSGVDNTCKRRFEWQLGDLPRGYDHKYVYSHLGYNLKITDLQAACEARHGAPLGWFFNQWVYGTGVPRVRRRAFPAYNRRPSGARISPVQPDSPFALQARS